jgi:starch synthase
VASDKADEQLVEYARQSGKPLLEYQSTDEADCFDNYNRFYEEL